MTAYETIRSFWLLALVAVGMIGCAGRQIPNTAVEDTSENREVIDFVESYRIAVEKQDVGKLLKLASRDYFDDMGTPTGDDDVDYDGLSAGLVKMKEELLDARYQISYRNLTYASHDRVLVDLLYTGWFRVRTPEGPQWKRRLEPHRMVLQRQDRELRIISGM